MSLCDPMDCSMPGFPVFHYLPEFAQTLVQQVGDAIQPSHPPSPSFPSAFNLSQHWSLFQWVGCLHQVTKILELQFQHQSFQWVFRVDFPLDWMLWSPCCPRDSQTSSPAPQFEGISSLALCLFMVQLSQLDMTTRKTIALTIQTFVSRVMSLFFNNTLSRFSLFFHQKAIVWIHGCSHCLKWFWSPRRENLSLRPPFSFLFAMQ